jgi:hypothetical protein
LASDRLVDHVVTLRSLTVDRQKEAEEAKLHHRQRILQTTTLQGAVETHIRFCSRKRKIRKNFDQEFFSSEDLYFVGRPQRS